MSLERHVSMVEQATVNNCRRIGGYRQQSAVRVLDGEGCLNT